MPVYSFPQILDGISLASFSDLSPSFRSTVVLIYNGSLLIVLDTVLLIVQPRLELVFNAATLYFWSSLWSTKTPKPGLLCPPENIYTYINVNIQTQQFLKSHQSCLSKILVDSNSIMMTIIKKIGCVIQKFDNLVFAIWPSCL